MTLANSEMMKGVNALKPGADERRRDMAARTITGGSDGVAHRLGDVDVFAGGELAVLVLGVADVVELLEDDLVFAGGLVGVLEREFGAADGGGDFLAVAADAPLEAGAPVVGDVAAGDFAPGELQGGFGRAFEFLVHGWEMVDTID